MDREGELEENEGSGESSRAADGDVDDGSSSGSVSVSGIGIGSGSGDEQRRTIRLELPIVTVGRPNLIDSDDSASSSQSSSDSDFNIDDDDDDDDHSSVSGNYENYFSDGSNSNYEEMEVPSVLLKRKPNHAWNIVKEMTTREMGMTLKPGKCGRSDILFEHRFYGSLHCVQRLELMYKLNKHKGCVNSINFHPEGHLLVSGADDLNIVIWDWSTNTFRRVIKTDHKENIFQSKFLHLESSSQVNIATCAKDGQVLLTQVPASGGVPFKRKLASHSRPTHKLYTNPAEPHVIVSAGEDGRVILSDVRQEKSNDLFTARYRGSKINLFSVAGHPLDINEICLAGGNRHVMLYDRRKAGNNIQPFKKYCPEPIKPSADREPGRKHFSRFLDYITCAVYNYDGSEILASYNDNDIYLFDTKVDSNYKDRMNGYTQIFTGHCNSRTIKGVSFFGPQSEFVVSGSDCANIYIWDKKTEAIVQWMMGDENGVVNCIECHPNFPVLATSGLDYDVKIWVPSNEKEPDFKGLRKTVSKNYYQRLNSSLTFSPHLQNLLHLSQYSRSVASPDNDSAQEDGVNEPSCMPF